MSSDHLFKLLLALMSPGRERFWTKTIWLGVSLSSSVAVLFHANYIMGKAFNQFLSLVVLKLFFHL